MMPWQWDVEASCMVQRTFEFGSCPRRCGGWGHPGHPGGCVWYFAMSWRFEQNLSTLNFWVLGLQWLHILKLSLSVSSLRLRLILLRSSAVDSWIVPRDPQLLNRQLQASCQKLVKDGVFALSASTKHVSNNTTGPCGPGEQALPTGKEASQFVPDLETSCWQKPESFLSKPRPLQRKMRDLHPEDWSFQNRRFCLRDDFQTDTRTFATIGIRNVVEKKTMHQMPNSQTVTCHIFLLQISISRVLGVWDAPRCYENKGLPKGVLFGSVATFHHFPPGTMCSRNTSGWRGENIETALYEAAAWLGTTKHFCCLKSYPKQLECIIKSHKIPKETGFLAANLKAKRRIWLPSISDWSRDIPWLFSMIQLHKF